MTSRIKALFVFLDCGHRAWRKHSSLFGKRYCRKCLDKVEFRFEIAMDRMVKNSFDLFDQFQKLPKEVQDKVLANMDLGSISRKYSNDL